MITVLYVDDMSPYVILRQYSNRGWLFGSNDPSVKDQHYNMASAERALATLRRRSTRYGWGYRYKIVRITLEDM